MELQEALLPQTYRAKRYVSKNLVNRRNKLYALQIEWSQMVTGDRLVVNSHDSSIVVQVSSTSSTVDDDDEFC